MANEPVKKPIMNNNEHSHAVEPEARDFSSEFGALKAYERAPATLAHLLSLPPLWGVVFAMGIIHYYQESSRKVAFQARQAIYLHLGFLMIALAGILMRLALTLIDAAFPGTGFGNAALWFDELPAIGLYFLFCSITILSAGFCSMGYNVAYPYFKKQLWHAPFAEDADDVYG